MVRCLLVNQSEVKGSETGLFIRECNLKVGRIKSLCDFSSFPSVAIISNLKQIISDSVKC